MKRTTSLPVCCLLFIMFYCLMPTQTVISQETDLAGRFGGEVEVTVVNLEIRVRDSKDEPVTGLDPEAFEVFENGEKVEISHFHEVKPSSTVRHESNPAQTTRVQVEPGTGDSTRLVLFVDDENIHPTRRNQALDEIGNFLSDTAISPPPRVTILRSARGLKWVLDDSDDPAEIRAALNGLRDGTGGAVFADADFRTLVVDIRNAAGLAEARGYVRQYAQQRRAVARATFNALSAAVAALAGEPGRLVLLYIGDGFPVEPGSEAFSLLDDAYPSSGALTESSEYQLRPQLNELIEQANASGVTFSAYDARGLEVNTAAGVDGAIAMGSIEGFALDRIRRSSRQAPLAALSDATGGAFSRTDNTIGNLLKIVDDDLTAYYSIGFESQVAPADGDRKIKVRVDRPGLTVRHKSSFRPRSPTDQRADSTLAALFLPPNENQLHLGVRPLEAEKKSRRTYLLPVDILIPLENLMSLSQPQGDEIKIELFFASCDEHGTTSPVQRVEVVGTRPETTGDRPPILSHRVTLQLEPGDHRLAVTAHDLLGGVTSSVSGTVSIP